MPERKQESLLLLTWRATPSSAILTTHTLLSPRTKHPALFEPIWKRFLYRSPFCLRGITRCLIRDVCLVPLHYKGLDGDQAAARWSLTWCVCVSPMRRLMNISCQGRVGDISIDTWDCRDMYLRVSINWWGTNEFPLMNEGVRLGLVCSSIPFGLI